MIQVAGRMSARVTVQVIAALVCGATLGYASSYSLSSLVVGFFAILAAVVAGFSLVKPWLTIAAFWSAYTVLTSWLGGRIVIQGMYYPVWAIMAINAVMYWRSSRRDQGVPAVILWIYGCFLGVVLVGLLSQSTTALVDTRQRLLIYSLGLLAALQIRRAADRVNVFRVTTAVSAVVSLWTIQEAVRSGFAYRGGVEVNQNYVATLICIGLVPLFVTLMNPQVRLGRLRSTGLWLVFGIGVYADLLLSSRGVTLAFVTTLAVLTLWRTMKKPIPWRALLVLAVVGVVAALVGPGASGLLERMGSAQVDSLNGRIPLWEAGLRHFSEYPPLQLLFGGGMGTSERVAVSVSDQTSMHNLFIQFLVDYGILGLGSFIGLIGLLAKDCFERLSDNISATRLGVVLLLLGVGVTTTVADNYLFWIALGTTWPATISWNRSQQAPQRFSPEKESKAICASTMYTAP